MKREAIPIRPEGVAETKKSVSGAEPISEAELNRHAGYDIREVLNRRDGDHLQARVQALLRSGMFSSRYVIVCQSICLRDDALVERRVARAIFASEVGESRGAIVNAIHERSLSQDSIDMTMNFSSGQSLFVGGEQVVTNVLDVNIVGNDVVSLEQKSRLDPCSVQFVSDIVDNASLIPLRDV